MSKPKELFSTTLPAPTGGLDFFNPLAAMSQSNTPWMVNAEADLRSVRVRNGYRIFATIPTGYCKWMTPFGSGASEVLYIYAESSFAPFRIIYKITQAGVVTPEYSDGVAASDVTGYKFGGGGGLAFPQANVLTAGVDNLVLLSSTGLWGPWSLSYNGNDFPLSGTFVFYRGRIYGKTDDNNPQYLAYGDVGQIQGVIPIANIFAAGRVFANSGRIAFLATFVSNTDNGSTEYFAIGNDLGEVLVYAGDNPGADNWTLAARLKIGTPIPSFSTAMGSSILEYGNDTLVFTYSGIISLKDIFSNRDKSGTAETSHLTAPITELWITLASLIPAYFTTSQHEYITGAYAENEKKIYVLINRAVYEDLSEIPKTSTVLIYDIDGKSWSMHRLSMDMLYPLSAPIGPCNITYFNKGIYLWSYNTVYKLDPASWLDQSVTSPFENVGYDFAIHSAPTTFEDSIATKEVVGYEPIVKQPTSAPQCGFGLKVSIDMGRKESGITNPAQTTEIAKRFYSVGGEGTFFQYKIEGNTATNSGVVTSSGGIDIYAINAFYKKGGIL